LRRIALQLVGQENGLHCKSRANPCKEQNSPQVAQTRSRSTMSAGRAPRLRCAALIECFARACAPQRHTPLEEPVGDLLPAVQRFAQRFTDLTGITVHVRLETDICVNGRLAAEALQVVAEGLSNMRRHTTAAQATVRLACSEDNLILRIENEGTDA
jgi:hypothetical protein